LSHERADVPAYRDADDAALVRLIREPHDPGRLGGPGGEPAFAELVRRYRHPVFRLAVSILGQGFEPEAEDVAQEVFVRVHHALGSFRGESAFSTWLYRIAFNYTLNVKARMRFRAPHVGDEVLGGLPSRERGAEQALHDAERRRAIKDCMAELPDVYQSALRLHYWLGASMAEIAALLDAPENTIKSYLLRARRLLKTMLTERGLQ
jgi:RNA polymerase sigma-70 factor, ECF subfamily